MGTPWKHFRHYILHPQRILYVARKPSVSHEPERARTSESLPFLATVIAQGLGSASLYQSPALLEVAVAVSMAGTLSGLALGHHLAMQPRVPSRIPVNHGRWSKRYRCIVSSISSDRSRTLNPLQVLGEHSVCDDQSCQAAQDPKGTSAVHSKPRRLNTPWLSPADVASSLAVVSRETAPSSHSGAGFSTKRWPGIGVV